MERITAFEPVVGENPKILILGTMPSARSLQCREYYGHGRNQFWRIMGELFSFESDGDYEFRKRRLMDEGIALWDVIHACERKGSLDRDIKNAEYNDIAGFIRRHPTIEKVVLNGGKARDIYQKRFQKELPAVEMFAFYSTSPANAISYERKFSQWKQLGDWTGESTASMES